VDADRPLKELFRLRPQDLLGLIGDAGAHLVSTDVVELTSLSRRVDTVVQLRRGREKYIRHLEFEMRYKKGLEFRCFEYATLLVVHLRLPVLTTVVLVEKSGPRELAFREVLGGRAVHERRFDVVRLWEMDPERAMRLGPGAAALIGAAEKATLPLIGQAARKIQQETKGAVQRDLLFVLRAFCGEKYTARQLAGAIPKEMVMASSLWAEAVRAGRKEGREKGRQKGREEGRKEGRLEGAVAEARAFCAKLTREHHPEVADRVVPLIDACPDVDRLHEWGLQASRLSDAEFVRLVTAQARSESRSSGRGRTPRPSRKAKSKR
jgi:predicted transposase YdaD